MVLILNTTNTEAVPAAGAVYAGAAAAEAQVAGVDTANRTAPVVAAAACLADRAINVISRARNNELQGRGESACGIITAP